MFYYHFLNLYIFYFVYLCIFILFYFYYDYNFCCLDIDSFNKQTKHTQDLTFLIVSVLLCFFSFFSVLGKMTRERNSHQKKEQEIDLSVSDLINTDIRKMFVLEYKTKIIRILAGLEIYIEDTTESFLQ